MARRPVAWFTIASLSILVLLDASDILSAQQSSYKLDQSDDSSLDALRVSSVSRFDGGNYHNISPRLGQPSPAQPSKRPGDEVINQIGKPLLVALPPTQQQQQQQQQRYKQDIYPAGKKLKPVSEVKRMTTSAPVPASASAAASKWIEPDPQIGAGEQSSNSKQLAYQTSSCRWIPLRDMKNVSFDTGEIIVRDARDQPCYIISIRAYIKFNDDAYFPLKGFRAYPNGAYRIDHYQGSGGSIGAAAPASALKVSPLNCSLPDNIVASHLVADYYLFKEEITLQLNCGYLVLQMRLDTAHQLSLASIAFYQDATAANNGLDVEANSAAKSRTSSADRAPPSMQTEHLVFSTSVDDATGTGTGAGSATDSPSEPLIVMPMYSRFICQQRVILTGNNSVQLVIERFEFKRLTGLPAGLVLRPHPRSAHMHGSATTRCPNPSGPGNFSTSLMARAATDADSSAPAGKQLAASAASAPAASNKWTSASAVASCRQCWLILLGAPLVLMALEARRLAS